MANNINITNVTDVRNGVMKAASKGFGTFAKNVALILLILIAFYILQNPEVLRNPAEFFSGFDKSSIWSIPIFFFLVSGIFQLSRSLLSDTNRNNQIDIAKATVAEQKKEAEQAKIDHVAASIRRIKSDAKTLDALKDIVIDLKADRACIFEMHNGTNALTGSPFLFADCIHEAVGKDMPYISDDFKNFNIVKYPFILQHFDEGTWIGSVEEIEAEDPRLAAELKFANGTYNAFVVLHGETAPIGFLIVSFKDDIHPTKTEIISELNQKAQVISILLDNKNSEE